MAGAGSPPGPPAGWRESAPHQPGGAADAPPDRGAGGRSPRAVDDESVMRRRSDTAPLLCYRGYRRLPPFVAWSPRPRGASGETGHDDSVGYRRACAYEREVGPVMFRRTLNPTRWLLALFLAGLLLRGLPLAAAH